MVEAAFMLGCAVGVALSYLFFALVVIPDWKRVLQRIALEHREQILDLECELDTGCEDCEIRLDYEEREYAPIVGERVQS